MQRSMFFERVRMLRDKQEQVFKHDKERRGVYLLVFEELQFFTDDGILEPEY